MQAFTIFDRILFGEWAGKPGDKLTAGLNLLMLASGLVLSGAGSKRLHNFRIGAVFALALVAFLLSSVIWSSEPQATIRQGVIYLTAVIAAIGIASNLDADEFMRLVAVISGLAALCSLFLMVVSPSDVYTTVGDFRGIFSQKNVLGAAMAMGALASLHGLRASRKQTWSNGLILVSVTFACFLSKSATSLLTIFILCSVYAVSAVMQKGGIARVLGITTMFVAVPVVAFIAISPDSMLELIGKDPTLTGRTEIWDYVIRDIQQRPWLGWGYDAFWSATNPAALEIDDAMHWMVPQAHNGLLEIFLHVGLVGVVFFLFLLTRNIRLGLRCLRTSDKVLGISTLMCCTSIIITGVSEAVLIGGLEATTGIFFITGFLCEQAIQAEKRRQYRKVPMSYQSDLMTGSAENLGAGFIVTSRALSPLGLSPSATHCSKSAITTHRIDVP